MAGAHRSGRAAAATSWGLAAKIERIGKCLKAKSN